MSGPAPQFRPRRSKAPQTGNRRRWFFLAGLAGLIAIAAVSAVIFLVTRDGDDADIADDLPPGSTGGVQGGPETDVRSPATQYVIQLGDTDGSYRAFPPQTFILSPLSWAANGYWPDPTEGEKVIESWGFKDGYQGTLEPLGQLSDVVQGKYYVRVEAVIFDTVGGAQKAYDFMEKFHKEAKGSEPQKAKGLANQSSAWKLTGGPVATSELVTVFHRFIFRRGNMLAIVQTTGADQFMTIDRARELAIIVDDKARGARPAPTPTPGRQGGSQLPPPPSPTPTPKP